jgi:hypothetical protein
MRAVGERDPTIHGGRHYELAYLANVLIAGCSIQSRPFADKEAAEAAVATCNLGLERLLAPPDYLVAHDLIGAFQTGWAALHEHACTVTAKALVDILATVRVADPETQSALNMLRVRLRRDRGATPRPSTR